MSEIKQADLLAILLTEDNKADAYLIKKYVENYANVTLVETLAKAVEEIQSCPPDIILLDLSLPDSSGGAHAVSHIREITRLPVLVVTGSDDIEVYEQCVLEGADSVLFKDTLNADELFRRIQIAINRRKYLSNYMVNHITNKHEELQIVNVKKEKCPILNTVYDFSCETENLIQKMIRLNSMLRNLNDKDTHVASK